MPRTKGSKNRPKSDFASQIAEKQSVIQTLTAEVGLYELMWNSALYCVENSMK